MFVIVAQNDLRSLHACSAALPTCQREQRIMVVHCCPPFCKPSAMVYQDNRWICSAIGLGLGVAGGGLSWGLGSGGAAG